MSTAAAVATSASLSSLQSVIKKSDGKIPAQALGAAAQTASKKPPDNQGQ